MLRNLIQIITGCGCEDTIEEAAYWTLINNGLVIVVDALWPTLTYPDPDAQIQQTHVLIPPNERFEDINRILKRHSLFDRFFYIRADDYMYNGTQYNLALDFIQKHNLPCEHILFHDGDEALDPIYTDLVLSHIQTAKDRGTSQLRFMSTIEILPGWKGLTVNDRLGGNFGFVWGKHLFTRRLNHFDGNFVFEIDVPFMITQVPLYHLHHFRRNALRRISHDGTQFSSGGITYDISNQPAMNETPYVKRIKEIYKNDFQVQSQGLNFLGDLKDHH